MVISFPINPDVGDLYTASNGITYQWTGDRWRSMSAVLQIPDITENTGKVLSNDGTELVWQTPTRVERFKLNYAPNGSLSGTANISSGIDSVIINSATSGEVTIVFDGYKSPPSSIVCYGYDYTNNKYYVVPVSTAMTLREVPGGGVSGSPTAFTGDFSTLRLRLREAETGASRGTFGTTTHAWIQFAMFE